MAWVAGWLASLVCLLAYIYISERASLWVWAALILLALLSPTLSAYQKAFGMGSSYRPG